MAKRVDPLKAKKAKQKKVAIGLCVLLAAVVAFQGPKMLKMMKGPQPAAVAAPATPVATPTASGAVPGPAAPASAAPAVPAQEAVLADSDVAPDAESGQLLSIDSFATKDPFAQQLTEACRARTRRRPTIPPAATPTETPSTSGAVPPGTFDPLGSNPQDQDPNAPPVSTTPSVDARPAATATETTISINGVTESVATLGEVPGRRPRLRPRLARHRRQVRADQRRRRQLHERQADDQAAGRKAVDAAEHLGRKPVRPRAPDGRGLRPAEEVGRAMTGPIQRLRTEEGFGLVELMISLVVLNVGILADRGRVQRGLACAPPLLRDRDGLDARRQADGALPRDHCTRRSRSTRQPSTARTPETSPMPGRG